MNLLPLAQITYKGKGDDNRDKKQKSPLLPVLSRPVKCLVKSIFSVVTKWCFSKRKRRETPPPKTVGYI